MSVLIGTIFLKIGNTQKKYCTSWTSVIFCAVNQGVFGGLMVINSFLFEQIFTLRERTSGTYFASAYFIAKILFDMLVRLPFKYK